MLRDVGELPVDLGCESVYAIDMVVSAGEDGSSGWSADGVCDVAMVEEHTLSGDTVEIRRMIDAGPIAADSFRRMVISTKTSDELFRWWSRTVYS